MPNPHVVSQIVDTGLCVRRGACEPACPVDAIAFGESGYPYVTDESVCTRARTRCLEVRPGGEVDFTGSTAKGPGPTRTRSRSPGSSAARSCATPRTPAQSRPTIALHGWNRRRKGASFAARYPRLRDCVERISTPRPAEDRPRQPPGELDPVRRRAGPRRR